MNKMALLLIAALLVTTFGCQNSEDEDVFNPTFPEAINFKKEAFRLDSLKAHATKEIQSVDANEIKSVDPKWSVELRPFSSALSEAGYLEDYTKTVAEINGNQSIITYTNQSDNSIRKAVFYMNKGEVNGLEIHKKDNRIIYEVEKHLTFFKDSIYLMKSRQNIPLIFHDSISIKGVIHFD